MQVDDVISTNANTNPVGIANSPAVEPTSLVSSSDSFHSWRPVMPVERSTPISRIRSNCRLISVLKIPIRATTVARSCSATPDSHLKESP